eukprot:superscaffoldBa00002545_g14602
MSPMTQITEEAVWERPDITICVRLLEQEMACYREESGKSQAEVERLMAAFRDAEMDRSGKEKKIAHLERQIKSPNIQKQAVPGEMRKDALTDGYPHSIAIGGADGGFGRDTPGAGRHEVVSVLHIAQAFLAAISESDANITLLELSSSKWKTAQEEAMTLKRVMVRWSGRMGQIPTRFGGGMCSPGVVEKSLMWQGLDGRNVARHLE